MNYSNVCYGKEYWRGMISEETWVGGQFAVKLVMAIVEGAIMFIYYYGTYKGKTVWIKMIAYLSMADLDYRHYSQRLTLQVRRLLLHPCKLRLAVPTPLCAWPLMNYYQRRPQIDRCKTSSITKTYLSGNGRYSHVFADNATASPKRYVVYTKVWCVEFTKTTRRPNKWIVDPLLCGCVIQFTS